MASQTHPGPPTSPWPRTASCWVSIERERACTTEPPAGDNTFPLLLLLIITIISSLSYGRSLSIFHSPKNSIILYHLLTIYLHSSSFVGEVVSLYHILRKSLSRCHFPGEEQLVEVDPEDLEDEDFTFSTSLTFSLANLSPGFHDLTANFSNQVSWVVYQITVSHSPSLNFQETVNLSLS